MRLHSPWLRDEIQPRSAVQYRSTAVSLSSRDIPLQLLDMFIAHDLYHFQEMSRPLPKPDKRLFADLKMLGISSFNIGFIDRVKPGSLPVMIAWKRFNYLERLMEFERCMCLAAISVRFVSS